MKKARVWFALSALIGLFLISFFAIWQKDGPIMIGVYDPEGRYVEDTNVRIEHNFFSWDGDSKEISDFVAKVTEQARIPLITIEPWPRDSTYGLDLAAVGRGEYDEYIQRVCSALGEREVWVRWGHEMEHTGGRYPWSGKTPADFIAGYRKFVSSCRTLAPQAKFIWSPAGDVGTEQYWVGEEYVDMIGLSAYSYPLYEQNVLHSSTSMKMLVEQKIARVQQFGRPLLIAELGVGGDVDQKERSLREVVALAHQRKLSALIYFNAQDHAGVWGDGVPTPDWRINQAQLDLLN